MRSISQIYAEAVQVRNNYLQLTELNTDRSGSKMSIINLLTYVMSVLIYTYESILTVFEVQIANIINDRINGTGPWYATVARKFQFNSNTQQNDAMQYNEDTLTVEYATEDESKRIIANSVYQVNEFDNSIYLKVCKDNSNSEEVNNGTPYMPLSDAELTAFKNYIKEIKFVGAAIYSISCPADILMIKCSNDAPIYYDNGYITQTQALDAIKASIIKFISEHKYNDGLYYQKVIDAIQETEHITTIDSNVEIYLTSYDETIGQYLSPAKITSYTKLSSGYMKIIDQSGNCTINSTNIKLQAKANL